MRGHYRPLIILVLAGLVSFVRVVPVSAAGPSLVMIYGGSLSEPTVLRNWSDNISLISGDTAEVTSDMLGSRPSFRLAFFWGQMWADYVASGNPLGALRAEQANQYGRFYPAIGFAEALVAIDFIPGSGTVIRHVPPEGLRLLTAHGVPTRLPFPPAALLTLISSEIWPWVGLGLLCLGGFKLTRLQQRRQRCHHVLV